MQVLMELQKNDITKIQYSNDIKKKIRVGCEW